MKSDIWMPLYIGDYLKHTQGLTNAEHGAYLRSIMAYWTKRSALDSGELRQICGREYGRIIQFYTLADGKWHHDRIEQELAKSFEMAQSRRAKAMKGVEARKLNQTVQGA
jgi:uncharacterized protein YdaU (DUF1376 family)